MDDMTQKQVLVFAMVAWETAKWVVGIALVLSATRWLKQKLRVWWWSRGSTGVSAGNASENAHAPLEPMGCATHRLGRAPEPMRADERHSSSPWRG
jgi:hypothetical protein